MKKGLLLALCIACVVAASASASPLMLDQGRKSLGFQADTSRPTINFGWNIANMTKFHAGGGWSSVEPSAPAGTTVESNDSWNLNFGVSRYLNAIDNDSFAPFIGASVLVQDNGSNQNTSTGFRGFFGVEAFVVDALSIGGNVGVTYMKEGDFESQSGTMEGGKSITTSSSAITANLYW